MNFPPLYSVSQVLDEINHKQWKTMGGNQGRKLFFGENLAALKFLLEEKELAGKIDLVYIDPPFASNQTFSINGDRANTISKAKKGGTLAYSDHFSIEEFLIFIQKRLILLRELLSPQGSIYLHTDYKIGHYVKVVMDQVFGIEHFRNDISRIKSNPKNFPRKAYGNNKDLILFYSKSEKLIWNEPKIPYTEADIKRLFRKKDKDGRRYTTIPLHAPGETQHGPTAQAFRGILPPKGRHWRSDVRTLEALDKEGLIEWSSNGNPRKKIFADEQKGKRVQDTWEFKDPQSPVYPTEKNAALLDRIIQTSSHPDSIVLDCFCGSGTTLLAAEKLGRNWIGIDQSETAIHIAKEKLLPYTDTYAFYHC